MCTCKSFCRWLPVLFVVGLIAWCYFIFTYDILLKEYLSLDAADPPTEIGSHMQGVAYTVAFNVIFALGMTAFARAVFTDPGKIPDSWVYIPDSVAQIPFKEVGANVPPETLELTGERKADGGFRVCRKSKPQMYKPDRAHFCKMLSRCVLKMDHFCPWYASPRPLNSPLPATDPFAHRVVLFSFSLSLSRACATPPPG